jgi:hypothetical protein
MGAEYKCKGCSKRAAISCHNQILPQPSLCGLSRYYPRVGGRDCKVDRRLLREGLTWRGYGTTKPSAKAVYHATSAPVIYNIAGYVVFAHNVNKLAVLPI